MDPDREVLRKAIDAVKTFPAVAGKLEGKACEIMGRAVVLDADVFILLSMAARRDLARMEAEAPKRATLEELADSFDRPGSTTEERQAAAVLRKLKEFRERWQADSWGSGRTEAVAEFLRSMP
jgi:hypothetical protein